MQIRLHGTRHEVATMLDALNVALDVHDISRTYTDRKPSTQVRVYLTASRRTA